MENKRDVKTINLSNCEVDIVAYLNWGEKEEIQTALLKGANVNQNGLGGFNPEALGDSKYKALSVCVREIRENGRSFTFNRNWMDGLRVEDGDLLYDAVDELVNPKKKLQNESGSEQSLPEN